MGNNPRYRYSKVVVQVAAMPAAARKLPVLRGVEVDVGVVGHLRPSVCECRLDTALLIARLVASESARFQLCSGLSFAIGGAVTAERQLVPKCPTIQRALDLELRSAFRA